MEKTINETATKREIVVITPTGAKRHGKEIMDSVTVHQTKVNGNWQKTRNSFGRGLPKKIVGQGFPY